MNDKILCRTVCRHVVCALSVLFLTYIADAQVMPGYESRQAGKETGKPFINRWAFRTNVLEWAMTIPNFSIEFDLSASEYNRSAVGLTAKYNWNTHHTHVPVVTFDLLDIRPEYRYYFRTLRNGEQGGRKSRIPSVKYLGAYVNYGQYALKLRKGVQGQAVGLGVSYGYALPVYQYAKGALDVDLGFSIGVQVTEYDTFRRDTENNCYFKVAGESKGWHFTQLPLVSELRIAFAWRAVSVRDRYMGTDPKKRQIRLAEADIEMAFADIRSAFDNGLDSGTKEIYESDKTAYRAGFVEFVMETAERTADNVGGYDVGRSAHVALERKIRSEQRRAIREFDRSMKKSE